MGLKGQSEYHAAMAARPPGGGGSSEPDAIEFGIAVLDEQIGKADVSFPATAEEVRHALGDREIPYDGKGRTITLGEALDQVPQSRFENKTEFLDALYPVFDRKRREGGGLLTSLRDALPSDAARAAQRSRTGGPPLNFCFRLGLGFVGPGVEAFDDIVYQHNVADGTDPAVRDDDARVPVDAPSEQLMVELREREPGHGLRVQIEAYVLDLADEDAVVRIHLATDERRDLLRNSVHIRYGHERA